MKTKLTITLLASSAALFAPNLEAQTTPGPMPGICNRACWGARNGTCTSTITLNRAIIHHTAGGEYSTSGLESSKARVRAIQNMDMDVDGWCDIGYHFMVDKFGNIFENRKNSIGGFPRGAHDSVNANSFGFTFMGYFHAPNNNPVTSSMMNAMYALIAWKMPSGWSPYGSGSYGGNTVGKIDGHRKAWSTACPGDLIHGPYITENYNGGPMRTGVANRRGAAPPPPPTAQQVQVSRKGDFNGDGKSDIVTFLRGTSGDVYVALSTGTGFTTAALWNAWACVGDEVPSVGDFNGDGLDDIISWKRGAAGDVFVSLSTGSSFAPGVKWQDWASAGDEIPSTGDFNGDGKDDIISWSRGTSGDAWVNLSTGTGFASSVKWSDWACAGTEIPAVGDFNGDGKYDIVSFSRGTSADAWVNLSTGSGFGSSVKWSDWVCANSDIPAVGDFNGDGKDDLINWNRGTAKDAFVALSTGTGFGTSTKWHDSICAGTEIPGVGDFNGDGKDDAISFTRGTTADVWVNLSSGSLFNTASKWSDWFCAGSELPQPASDIW